MNLIKDFRQSSRKETNSDSSPPLEVLEVRQVSPGELAAVVAVREASVWNSYLKDKRFMKDLKGP
jgi:hypothetical protein